MIPHRLYLIAALLAATPLSAQDAFVTLTAYEVSVPIGDTRRFIPNASFMGLTWEGRWAVTRRASAGVVFGINEFSQRSNGTTNFPSGAATGPQFRYLLSMPLLVTGYVYPFGSDRRLFYFGGGAGVARIDQMFELGTRQLGRANWHFILAPEIGAEMHRVAGDLVGLVSVRYNMPFDMGDYVGGGTRSFRHFTMRLGLGYEMGEEHTRLEQRQMNNRAPISRTASR